MLVSIIIFAFTIFFLISFDKSDVFLSKDSTDSAKGYCMLLIMSHHILNTTGYPEFVSFIRMSGYICTGIFFFLSGYGNYLSLSNKKTIKITWITRRLKKLYMIFLTCYVANLAILLVYDLLGKEQYSFSIKKTLGEICIFSLPETINWFPKVIIVTLVIMFIIFKTVKNESSRILLLIIIPMVYAAICAFLGIDKYWYNSVLCFPMGALVAMKKDQIKHFFSRMDNHIHISIIIAILIMSIVTSHFWGTAYILQIIPCLMYSVLLVFTLSFFSIKNVFFQFIGTNSFEFYLIHVMWFTVLKRYVGVRSCLYAFAGYILSLLCVCMYKKCQCKLSGIKKQLQ